MKTYGTTKKYKEGQHMTIVDNDFNKLPIGTEVKIVSKDNTHYHIKTVAENPQWWWVEEKQILPKVSIQTIPTDLKVYGEKSIKKIDPNEFTKF